MLRVQMKSPPAVVQRPPQKLMVPDGKKQLRPADRVCKYTSGEHCSKDAKDCTIDVEDRKTGAARQRGEEGGKEKRKWVAEHRVNGEQPEEGAGEDPAGHYHITTLNINWRECFWPNCLRV